MPGLFHSAQCFQGSSIWYHCTTPFSFFLLTCGKTRTQHRTCHLNHFQVHSSAVLSAFVLLHNEPPELSSGKTEAGRSKEQLFTSSPRQPGPGTTPAPDPVIERLCDPDSQIEIWDRKMITQYWFLFWDWLISRGHPSFLWLNSIHRITNHDVFTHWTVNELLGCFHLLAGYYYKGLWK